MIEDHKWLDDANDKDVLRIVQSNNGKKKLPVVEEYQ